MQTFKELINLANSRAVTRALIGEGGGVYIHIFVLCPTNFFRNQLKNNCFEKKSVGHNTNI